VSYCLGLKAHADVLENIGADAKGHVKRVRSRIPSPTDHFRADGVAADWRVNALVHLAAVTLNREDIDG